MAVKRALLQVSLKVLLRNGEKVLLVRGDKGEIDLPGGRIEAGEENVPLETIIAREIREELGEDVKFHSGNPLFVNRVFRKEDGEWIFAVVYDAVYISGDIRLSKEHISFEWVDRGSYQVRRDDFLPDDTERYQSFKRYFDSLASN